MLKVLRNISYGAMGLSWAVAGLDGAMKDDFSPRFFAHAGRVGFLFLVLALAFELFRRLLERESITRLFEARHVKRGELAEVRLLSEKYLPNVPDLEQLQMIFEASRKCVWFVESTRRNAGGKKV